MNPPSVEQLAPLVLLMAVAILTWDVTLAGWVVKSREAPRVFTQLTSICGLLVAPAIVIAIASGTESGARTVAGIAWLLPFVCTAFVLQVLYAMLAGLVSPVVAIPIVLYNIAVATVVIGDFLVAQYGAAPLPFQAAVAARDVVFGITLGRAALVSPLAVLVPMLAPAYPARWRLSALVRVFMVLTATASFTLLLIEWPRGVAAIWSYQPSRSESLQPRASRSFLLGMRLLPVLDGPPPARTVRADMALATALGPDVVLVVLDAEGTRASALDSLARVLEPLRTDSVVIAVALHHGRVLVPASDPSHAQVIERVLRRLKPHVLFPGIGNAMPSVFVAEMPTVAWWSGVLTTANAVRDRVRPATRIGIALSRLDAADSAAYAWAETQVGIVDLIGATIYPSYSGMPGVDARLRALERWHAAALARPADSIGETTANDSTLTQSRRNQHVSTHWLINVGGLPHAHGDASQVAAVRHVLAWGSRHEWVRAAIVGEPADYHGWLGVRDANGRIRPVWDSLISIKRIRGDF